MSTELVDITDQATLRWLAAGVVRASSPRFGLVQEACTTLLP
jgi:hypothetical protein